MISIEEQIQFIKSRWYKADGEGADMYKAVLDTLMQTKERLDERREEHIPILETFITPEITRFLKAEGFIRGSYHDPYSGTKELVIFSKRLGTDESRQYHTACITKNEIGIEVEYDYGGGQSGGYWEFEEENADSFMATYKMMAEAVKRKQLELPKA